jgi:hypothetical protein
MADAFKKISFRRSDPDDFCGLEKVNYDVMQTNPGKTTT